jgi:hypothetical protein
VAGVAIVVAVVIVVRANVIAIAVLFLPML